MKYQYQFNNETIIIEVDEKDYEVLLSLDKDEYNSNRKHIRRYPVSLDSSA